VRLDGPVQDPIRSITYRRDGADTATMTTVQQSLRDLISRELYAPDDHAVAAAILARAAAHATIARALFHSELTPRTRSVRPGARARQARRLRPPRLDPTF
jgi:hypothetical protein